MADIKAKNINDFSDWTIKELRKLRMVAKNRISSLDSLRTTAKELPKNHPLFDKGSDEIKEILLRIAKAEKANCK